MARTAARVRVVEVTGPGGDDFPALHRVWQAVDATINPDDPPIPPEELAGELFAVPADERARAWLAREGNEATGAVKIRQHRDGVNDGIVEVYAMTHPDRRRRGVACALLDAALAGVAELGGTSVVGWSTDEAGAALCRKLGLTHRQDDRCSRLRLADVDDEQQRAWIDEAPARAAGYRLEGWVGVCPERWAELLASALDAMVDAPIGDFDFDPQPITPARLVDRERSWAAQGFDIVTTLALAPGGGPAGASQLLTSHRRPSLGSQADTGVLAAHRGHALGRWLKAENLRRARAHEPALAVVETYNAEANPHMLAINVAMGFRPYLAIASFQGSLAEARASVAAA
jgi:GNAT superfamily N-acetyltransferase